MSPEKCNESTIKRAFMLSRCSAHCIWSGRLTRPPGLFTKLISTSVSMTAGINFGGKNFPPPILLALKSFMCRCSLTHSAFFHHERNPWENSMPQPVVTECFWPSCHLFRLFKKGLMGIHSGDNLLHKSDFKLTLKCSTQMMKEIIQDSFLLECLCAKSDSGVKRSI